MALNLNYLTLVSQPATPADVRLWRYVTTDTFATVNASGYFNGAGTAVFNIGDIIQVIVVDSVSNIFRTSAEVHHIYVSSILGSTINTAGVTIEAFGDITATGTTTARSIEDHLGDMADVRDFGAKGNNSDDDRAAIQTALDSQYAIYFPPNRNYIIDGGLTIRSGTILYGLGHGFATGTGPFGSAVLRFTGTADACISSADPTNPFNYGQIKGLSMYATGTYDHIIDIYHPTQLLLNDIRLDTTSDTTGGIRCLKLHPASAWVDNWYDVEVHLPQTSTAYSLESEVTDSTIVSGHFTGGLGVKVRNAGLVFLGTRFDVTNPAGAGITITNDGQIDVSATIIQGCYFELNNISILLDGDANDSHVGNFNTQIVGNLFWNPGGSGAGAEADIKLVNETGPVIGGPIITGNRFWLPEGTAVGSVAEHISYDPTRWSNVGIGNNTYGNEAGSSDLVGTGQVGQAPIKLDQSHTQLSDASATTATDIPLTQYTIPAPTLNPGDTVEIDADWIVANSTNNKNVKVKFGDTFYTNYVINTSGVTFASTKTRVHLITSGAQKGPPANFSGFGPVSGSQVTSTVDTTVDVPIVFSVERATAGESIALDSYKITLLRANLSTLPFPYPGAVIDLDFINQLYWWDGDYKTTGDFTTYTLNGSSFGTHGLTPSSTVDITLLLSGISTAPPGTLVGQVYPTGVPAVQTNRPFELNDGTLNEVVSFRQTTGGTINSVVVDGGVTQANNAFGWSTNTTYGIGVSFQTNNVIWARNGTPYATPDTSCTMPSPTKLQVGKTVSANTHFEGAIGRVLLFDTAFTQSELNSITLALSK